MISEDYKRDEKGVLRMLQGLNSNMGNIKSHFGLLQKSLVLKDNIIDYLQGEIKGKDGVIQEQQKLIMDMQYQFDMFFNILINLKEAKNKKQVNDILKNYDLDIKEIPYLN